MEEKNFHVLSTFTTFAFTLKEIVVTPSPPSVIIVVIGTMDENNVVVVDVSCYFPLITFKL